MASEQELLQVIHRLRTTLVLIGETAKIQMDDEQREAVFKRRISHIDDQILFRHIYEYALKGIQTSEGLK
jgi:hypothetical protein